MREIRHFAASFSRLLYLPGGDGPRIAQISRMGATTLKRCLDGGPDARCGVRGPAGCKEAAERCTEMNWTAKREADRASIN